ncbi:hypothetical protein BH18CHL2_BH18CHL2_09190 [soil metagenome]
MKLLLTRRAAAIAATGVLGVGLIGGAALATLPAPSGGPTSAAPSATTGARGDQASGDRAERIRRVLDGLGDKGVITKDQAEAIGKAFAAARPKAGERRDRVRMFVGNVLQVSAEYLGLSEAEIKQRVAAGESLASIAAKLPGKSRDGLISALNDAAEARLKQAIAKGTITPAQAEAARTKLTVAIVRVVDHVGLPKGPKAPRTK